ncbi:unnamed protein product [marine sediment metagenome]|uniref:Uncharacterized protein n=1 Tax=marine sediment metagenome TaxID=412755 RepID=X1FSW4_9ZZZZ
MAYQTGSIIVTHKVTGIRVDAVSNSPAELPCQALGHGLGFKLSHVTLEKVLPHQVMRFYPVRVNQKNRDIALRKKPA